MDVEVRIALQRCLLCEGSGCLYGSSISYALAEYIFKGLTAVSLCLLQFF